MRGILGAESRSLSDGTPNPSYLVDWAAAVQYDLVTGSALRIEKKDLKRFKA